jgi:5'-deoxynucleotidase YfbR-like HD superfamily hydrolase
MKEWIAVLRAADTAARWHVHQRRKGIAQEPYINHLLEVASLVSEATSGSDATVVIAALLHDAVEDQEVPVEMIAREFGKQVADIVMEVTDDKTLPKDERKRKQIETAPKKCREAKLIKLADKTSNLRTIASSPAADWSVKRRLEYIEWAKNVVGCRSRRAVAQSTVGWCVAGSESWTEIGPSPFTPRPRAFTSPKSVRMTLACIRKSSLNYQVFYDAVGGPLCGGRVKVGSSNVGRSRFVHCHLL